MTLYHYTCAHGHGGIRASGELVPASWLTDRAMPWTGRLLWLTDLPEPMRDALGLTSITLSCDRTAHRYRVTDETDCLPWTEFARGLSREQRESLEGEPGSRPVHWYVADRAVPCEYDPILVGAS